MNPANYTGTDWVKQHKAGVMSILGKDTPLVLSQGDLFYNADRWTGRYLVQQMCAWAKKHTGACATRDDVKDWVVAANNGEKPQRKIVIAATPPKISLRVALALVGGGYHEAWHTRYSCRRSLFTKEVAAIVLPRWAQVPDWSKFESMLQTWNNIIEDIRIERRGNEEYPGCYMKMLELQDFILEQERESCSKALGTDQEQEMAKTLRIVSVLFRDLGLGYDTDDQRKAFETYHELNPEACEMVETGPLRSILDQAINLSVSDDLGCIRLAMDVMILLSQLVNPKDMEEAQKEAENASGGSGKTECPACHAPANCLVARPLSDGNGGKVPGKMVITCSKCGWQEIVNVQSGQGSGSGSSQEDSIRFEDVPQTPGEGDPSKSEGGDSGEGSEKGPSSEGGESSEGDGENAQNGNKEGVGQGSRNKSGPDPKNEESTDKSKPSRGAGGHYLDKGPVTPWQVLAEDILNSDNTISDMKDMASALQEAVDAVWDREGSDCRDKERVWRPWSLSLDEIKPVKESREGRAADETRAMAILESVRSEASFLRARLRAIIRAVEQRAITHGVRKGKDLSERMLVNSVASLRSGRIPGRAYYTVSDRVDTSIASAIVLDQSGSMSGQLLVDATRAMMAITEPLDANGGAVLALGFRDGAYHHERIDSKNDYHRTHGVIFDIFKNFDERFISARWKFANTRGDGGTPMADGVQFALNALQGRTERHKILWVLTDGEPNSGHGGVIQRQIRLARESGIHVIGVGIGTYARSVTTLFPDHIWAKNIPELPSLLIQKLNSLLDFRGFGQRRSG